MPNLLPFLFYCTLCLVVNGQPPRAIVVEKAPPIIQPQYGSLTLKGVKIHYVQFDSRTHQLTLTDQVNGPGSQWKDSATLGKNKNALAVINGGFFTPEGKPLGKLISQGQARGASHSSSLGSGFIYFSRDKANILRRSKLNKTIQHANPHTLLQCGPMLNDQGKLVSGLSGTQARTRSFIAQDKHYYWLIGYAESATLAGLGKALEGSRIGDVSVYSAINLDGGRSSDLWVSPSVKNGNKTFRAFWNKPVRNFLLLSKK